MPIPDIEKENDKAGDLYVLVNNLSKKWVLEIEDLNCLIECEFREKCANIKLVISLRIQRHMLEKCLIELIESVNKE